MKYDFNTVIDRSDKSAVKWSKITQKDLRVNKSIVPFSVADLDIKNAPELVRGISEYIKGDGVFGYTLRSKSYESIVCNWMKRKHNWKIKKEWIVNSPGVIPAIYNSVNAYTNEGDGVIIFTPVYYPFFNAIKENNRKIVECPLVIKDNNYQIDYELFQNKAKEANNKMLIFCSPHNPIGKVWSKNDLAMIGGICKENNILIVSDEIHFDIIMPGNKHTVFASVSKEYANNIITCTSPSKSFNIAGLQISNVIISNEVLRNKFIKEQRKKGILSMNSLGYKACEIVYTQCEEWLNELIHLVYLNYKILVEYLRKHIPDVVVYPLEGTYMVWMDWSKIGFLSDQLNRFMCEKAEVYFDNGDLFSKETSCFERMNIACPTKVMMDALMRIVNELKK